jgi:hypothetical protein
LPRWSVVLLTLCCVSISVGCGSGDPAARYVPAAGDAEAALSTALEAWKAGTPTGPVPNTSPVIHVTDSFRRRDERLDGFRILGEVPGDTPRCYAVELQFDPPRQEKVRYVIVGIDPLWVFRMEDYQLLAHWEHRMDDVQDAANRSAPEASAAPGSGGP